MTIVSTGNIRHNCYICANVWANISRLTVRFGVILHPIFPQKPITNKK